MSSLQATTEMPKDKKTALQQIVYYYVPTYPFFGWIDYDLFSSSIDEYNHDLQRINEFIN